MGTFAEYIGTMDIPENRRAEYAQWMLRLTISETDGYSLCDAIFRQEP